MIKRVFISHPFKDDPEGNRKKVEKICKEIIEEDDFILPISPLHCFSFLKDDDKRNDIMSVCYDLIMISDEVWLYGDSDGCHLEKQVALDMGKKVIIKYEE